MADDGTWSYDEKTTLQMNEFPDPFPHTDHNTLHKVGGSGRSALGD